MPVVNCREFDAALRQAVESRTSLATALTGDLRSHAQKCPQCKEYVRHQMLFDEAVARWRAETPTIDLTDVVLSRWAAEQAEMSIPIVGQVSDSSNSGRTTERRDSHRRRLWWLASGLVAATAVLVIPHFVVPTAPDARPVVDSDGPGTTPAPPQFASPQNVPVVEAVDEPQWPRLVRETKTVYDDLAVGTKETWSDVKLLVSAWTPDATRGIPEDMPTPARSSGWFDGLKEELVPVGRDVTRPLEFLREALPAAPVTL
jgi:hypothetical protein